MCSNSYHLKKLLSSWLLLLLLLLFWFWFLFIIIIILIFLLPTKLCSGCSCDEQQYTISIQKIKNHHIQWCGFFFIKNFFLVLIFSQIPNQSRTHFRPWLKKFVFSHRIYCPNFVQIDNVQQCHFQFFKLFWVILTLKNISKNLKLCVRFSFGTPYNIFCGQKNPKISVQMRSEKYISPWKNNNFDFLFIHCTVIINNC